MEAQRRTRGDEADRRADALEVTDRLSRPLVHPRAVARYGVASSHPPDRRADRRRSRSQSWREQLRCGTNARGRDNRETSDQHESDELQLHAPGRSR